MEVDLPLQTAKLRAIENLDPGTFFYLAAPQPVDRLLCLRCTRKQLGGPAFVVLEGKQAMTFRSIGDDDRGTPTLAIPPHELELRFDPTQGRVDDGEMGALVINSDGPFVKVMLVKGAGAFDYYYLSLSDWAVQREPPDGNVSIYASWKLVTAEGSTLLSVPAGR